MSLTNFKKFFRNNEEYEFFQQIRKKNYNNQESILKEYHDFLSSNNIYPSYSPELIRKQLKNRIDLSNDILNFYKKAKLENEKVSFLEDLKATGYNKDELTKLVLGAFVSGKKSSYLWHYADLLYSIKNFCYLEQYIDIIKDESYGEDRQMLILLVGKSKKAYVIPILKDLLSDSTVYGHALDALSDFSGDDIDHIMQKYIDCDITWIREIAVKHLSRKKRRAKNTGDGSVS